MLAVAAPLWMPRPKRLCDFMSRRDVRQNRRVSTIVSSVVLPTPPVASGLLSWVRGDLGVTLNSGKVSAWADQSGNNNNWKQTTAIQQPAYVASPSGGANNQAYVSFVSSGTNVLTADSHTAFTPQSFWVVWRPGWPGSAVQTAILNTNGGAGVSNVNDGTPTSTVLPWGIGDGSTTPASLNFTQGTDVTMLATANGATSVLWDNNATSSTNSGDATGGFAFAGSVLGAVSSLGANPMNAFLYEVMMFNRIISAADQTTLQNYAHTRYGV